MKFASGVPFCEGALAAAAKQRRLSASSRDRRWRDFPRGWRGSRPVDGGYGPVNKQGRVLWTRPLKLLSFQQLIASDSTSIVSHFLVSFY